MYMVLVQSLYKGHIGTLGWRLSLSSLIRMLVGTRLVSVFCMEVVRVFSIRDSTVLFRLDMENVFQASFTNWP